MATFPMGQVSIVPSHGIPIPMDKPGNFCEMYS